MSYTLDAVIICGLSTLAISSYTPSSNIFCLRSIPFPSLLDCFIYRPSLFSSASLSLSDPRPPNSFSFLSSCHNAYPLRANTFQSLLLAQQMVLYSLCATAFYFGENKVLLGNFQHTGMRNDNNRKTLFACGWLADCLAGCPAGFSCGLSFD